MYANSTMTRYGIRAALLLFILTGGDIVPAFLGQSAVARVSTSDESTGRSAITPANRGGIWLLESRAFGEYTKRAAAIGNQGPPCGDSSGDDADPVYFFNGEFYLEATDLRIPGRGFDFVLSRKYRSITGDFSSSVIGNGWDMSYTTGLFSDPDDPSAPFDLVFSDGAGRQDLFSFQTSSNDWARDEYFRKITLEPDGTLTMLHSDKTSWRFRALDGTPAQGLIKEIVDRNGNTMTFSYFPHNCCEAGHGAGCSDPKLESQVCDIDPFCCNVDWDAACVNTLQALGYIGCQTPRIQSVIDTLGREIVFSYNAAGLLESVTDWTGRTVTYAYYDGVEPGGNFGDLKSVTTPSVVGAPNGNDFPNGKTTIYTYTTGFSDDRLNHQLLTVTDPKGQVYLQNIYAHTLDPGDPRYTENPSDPHFRRIVAQIHGGGRYDFNYTDANSADPPIPPGATKRVIINNRKGHVKERFYDADDRLVARREYTGVAPDPAALTTDSLNRPENPLRPSEDPDFFDTQYTYNIDSKVKTITHPNGNVTEFVYQLDLDTDTPRRSRGNIREVRQKPGSHTPVGGQTEIVEIFEYDTDFGGCCGFNFVTRHVDGRGNETLHEYDADGNRIHTQHRIPSIVKDWEYNAFGQMTAHILPDNGSGSRRRDEYAYYSSGPQTGYLQQEVIDATGFNLTTAYEYDAVGNVTRKTDPRGHDTQYVVNQLNQIVREISRETTDGSGVRYEQDTYYDANDNVVQVDLQNVDENGVIQPNTHFTTTYEYDILNDLTRITQEVEPGHDVVTEHEYDANKNHTLTRFGEATNGNQPTNVVRQIFDERDLLFQTIRADGDADQSTTQFDYDGNKNRTRVSQGLEGAPRATQSVYDAYDRLVSSTDPMGNQTTSHYDANGNTVSSRTDGELIDEPGPGGNVRLSERSLLFDAMDRLTQSDTAFFNAVNQAPIDDGQSTRTIAYSHNSQVLAVTDDNNLTTTTTYDTANRRSVVTDAKNNTATYGYDANSNVVSILETEKSDLGGPDEQFTTTFAYDNLDRLIQRTDSVGNTMQYQYDSRNNSVLQIDALNHQTRYLFDGLDRLLRTIRDMDGDGADAATIPGDGDPDIVTAQAWDDSSRLIGQTDDNGNTTTYVYDALNRKTAEVMADCTEHSWTFDVHDNRVASLDPNGSATACTYDLNNRLTDRLVFPGPGVSDDTTFEHYEFDGLSRLVLAQDDDSIVERTYDSLSNILAETQTIGRPGNQTAGVVASEYDGDGNETKCTYPGGRVIETTFDELDRKKTITDATDSEDPELIAEYWFVGPGRVARRDYGNGTRMEITYDGITGAPNPANDFGVKKIVRTKHSRIADGSIIDDRIYTWDRMGNKIQRADIRADGPQWTHDYEYDAAYRLVHTHVMRPGEAPEDPPVVVRDTVYNLDGMHNRTSVSGSPDDGEHVGVYAMDPTCDPSCQPPAGCEPADRQMNQYTATPFDRREYDKNGNLVLQTCIPGDFTGDQICDIDDLPAFVTTLLAGDEVSCLNDLHRDALLNGEDVQRFANVILGTSNPPADAAAIAFDFRNRMVEYHDRVKGQRHMYAYDPLLRRVQKVVDADGASGDPITTRYFHGDQRTRWQVLEEQGDTQTTQAIYTHGWHIDEILSVRRDSDGNLGFEEYWFHADDLFNTMVASGDDGLPAERYEFADYGNPAIYSPDYSLRSFSILGNTSLFTGRERDSETGLYCSRTRMLEASDGRFLTRDVIGIWGDGIQLGNGHNYASSNPFSFVDPFGLCAQPQEGDVLEVKVVRGDKTEYVYYEYKNGRWVPITPPTKYRVKKIQIGAQRNRQGEIHGEGGIEIGGPRIGGSIKVGGGISQGTENSIIIEIEPADPTPKTPEEIIKDVQDAVDKIAPVPSNPEIFPDSQSEKKKQPEDESEEFECKGGCIYGGCWPDCDYVRP